MRPTWTYSYVSCAGQNPQTATFVANSVTTSVARIEVAKSVSPQAVRPDQILTYTISIPNTGRADSSGTLAKDTIPAGTTYVAGSTRLNGIVVPDQSGVSPLVAGMQVNSPLAAPGVVVQGQTATVTFQVRVDRSTTTAILNVARVDPDGPTKPLPELLASATTPVQPHADVSVAKNGPNSAVAGTNVTYVITARNNGPSNASGVALSDPVPPGLTLVSVTGDCTALPCSLGTLPDGEERMVIVTYAIPGAYTTPDPIVNTASLTTTTEDLTPGNNSTSKSTALNAPVADLRITKTNGVDVLVPGSSVTYTIEVTNAGPSTATSAVVTDTFPVLLTGVSWTCLAESGAICGSAGASGPVNQTVTVPVGGKLTYTATGTLPRGAIGTLVNTATVTPAAGTSDPSPASATDSDPIEQRADVFIVKDGPLTIVPGANITYAFTAANAGPSEARDVVVEELFPAGLIFVSTTAPCEASPCSLGTLKDGEAINATVTFMVPIDFLGVAIPNTARITSSTADPDTTNNVSTVVTAVDHRADLAVDKTASGETVVVGDQVEFIVNVRNVGPGPATGVIVTDLLPAGLSLVVAHASQGSYVADTGQWTVGTLLAQEFATLTTVATLTETGEITNLAVISGHDQIDPNAGNDSAAATVNGAPAADVAVNKTVGDDAPSVGENVTFVVTVTNRGPNTATAVVVEDAVPTGLSLVSAIPSQGTYTAPTWTIGDIGDGDEATLTIAATVTATGPIVNTAEKTQQGEADKNPANNRSTVTLNAGESANLDVTKTPTRLAAFVGEQLTFDVIVKNLGPSPASGVSLNDDLPAGLALVEAAASQGSYDQTTGIWSVGSIGATGSAVLSVRVTVTDPGTTVNTASIATSDQPDPDADNNSSSAIVAAARVADLAIAKTLAHGTTPGFEAVYSIVVTNGPSPVTGATVTDTFPALLLGPTWGCSADPGSSCAAASGSGDLATTVDLEAGDSAMFVVRGTIAPSAVGLFVNTATVTAPAGVTDDPTTNNTATSSVTLTPVADVRVTKDGPPSAVAGTNVVYTIEVTNSGPSDAVGVMLNESTPTGLTFVSNTGACTTAFPCDLGTLPPGNGGTVTTTFAIPSGYTTPDPIVNTATVTSTTADPVAGNNSATANTPLGTPLADLQITKTNGGASVVAGLPTTYTITITNAAGPSDAFGAIVTDVFPATLTGVTWTCVGTSGGTCPASGSGDISATVNVPVGETVVFTATGTVAPDATGTLVNSAAVDPPPGVPNQRSAISTDTDTIVARADLALGKTGPTSVVAGNQIAYTITVSNTGPSTASDVVVTDPTAAGLVFVSTSGDCTTAFPCPLGALSPGPSGNRTITATYQVPLTYVDPDPITNVATASAATDDPDAANNSATVTTSVVRPDVVVSKTVTPPMVAVGGQATFEVVVSNPGRRRSPVSSSATGCRPA